MKRWLLTKAMAYWNRRYERASNHAYDVHQSIVYAEREAVKIENLIKSIDLLEKIKLENY